jgi:hypothetical protein
LVIGHVPFLRAGAAELAYTPVEVPLPPVSKPLLNDKGQVLTWANGTVQMYLPTADYGLSAGVHPMGTMPAGGALIDFNTNGDYVIHTIQGVAQGVLHKDGNEFNFPASTVLGMDLSGRVLFHATHASVREVNGSVITVPFRTERRLLFLQRYQ